MRSALVVLCGVAMTTVASAQDAAIIDLAGLIIGDGREKLVESTERLDPAFAYHYELDAIVQGESGLFQMLIPKPTPLNDVLDLLSPGASSDLEGDDYNRAGMGALETRERIEKQYTLFGKTISFGLTLFGGVRSDGTAYRGIQDLHLPDAELLGTARIVEGTLKITRLNVVTGDLNWDGQVTDEDRAPFYEAINHPAAYKSKYGHKGVLAGDVNRDGILDFQDTQRFLKLVLDSAKP